MLCPNCMLSCFKMHNRIEKMYLSISMRIMMLRNQGKKNNVYTIAHITLYCHIDKSMINYIILYLVVKLK